MADTKTGTAPGPSQVSIDTIKLLDEICLTELNKFFNKCLHDRKIPENMNCALMRLLPKTETGFYIDKTRPANAEMTQLAGRHRIYTDGATIPGERTGWGFTVMNHAEEEVIARAGRLRGDQSNDIAEAMALLQALQSIHLHTEVDIYIDNTGVLDTSKVNLQQDPRARSQQTARAIWNRIMPILRERDTRGIHTALHWIHSHTDDEE